MADYEFESFLEFIKRNPDLSVEILKDYLSDVICIDHCTKTAIRPIGGGKRMEIYGTDKFDERVETILKYKTVWNTAIYLAGFYAGSKRYTQENVSCIKSIAIDIDYRKNFVYKDTRPKYILGMMAENDYYGLPTPSYAEYGHQIRLLWVLDEKVTFPKNSTDAVKRKKMIALYRRIQTVICGRINSEADLHAEPQEIHSLIRLPYSVNAKDGSIIGIENLYGKRFKLETLKDEILPDLPDWYDSWDKGRSKRKKRCKSDKKHPDQAYVKNDFTDHNARVLQDLVTIQQYHNERGATRGFRQTMCWVYYQYASRNGNDHNEAVNATLAFNQGFKAPLRAYRLERDLRTCKVLNGIRNQTILNKSDISSEEAKELHLSIAPGTSSRKTVDRPSYRAKRERIEKEGMSRKQQYEKRIERVRELKAKGLKDTEIAKELNITTRTVRNLKNQI